MNGNPKMKNMKTATEWLIEQLKSKEWQDNFIWHKEEIFEQARKMDRKELSDQEIEEGSVDYIKGCDVDTIVERSFFRAGAKWYRKKQSQ